MPILRRINSALDGSFPERRLFIRSEDDTRFVRISPISQLVTWLGGGLFIAWSVFATALLIMDNIGSGNIRDQAMREQMLYEQRLNELSYERDMRAQEAAQAQERFNSALGQISAMQLDLLATEERREELEKAIEIIQATLRRTSEEREQAREEAVQLATILEQNGLAGADGNEALDEAESTLDVLAVALEETSAQRDQMILDVAAAKEYVAELELERDLLFEKNDRIFSQLEDAVSLSLEPLDKMFRAAGMPTERVLDTIRDGYSGLGGPLTPLTFSTKGQLPDPDSIRANGILERLDRMNVYRIAAEKVPFSLPLKTAFRYTSGFGPRWGRMHNGTDFAGAYGSPIYTTADGVVIWAGWQSGYGRLVKIRHEFGIETRYAHLSQIRVSVGQRVSRGDRIGDMGNSGRSTGTHLHYEIRKNGEAVNAMTFIKAGRDVF